MEITGGSDEIRPIDAESEKRIVENNFLSREKFSPEALKIVDLIDDERKKTWEEYEGDAAGEIPSLDESIKKILGTVVKEQYPGFQNSRDDGFLSLNGFEWVTKEMALDEYERLCVLKEKGLKVDTQIHQITDWIESRLHSVRQTLAGNAFLSHATVHTDRILESGTLSSRELTGVIAASYSGEKDESQEDKQISMYLGTVGMRYGSKGVLEGLRGAFFFPGLPILLRSDISFFSADGLHIFSENGTSFGLKDALLVTSVRDYDQAMNGINTSYMRVYGQPPREDSHKEILTPGGKAKLNEIVLRNNEGNPVLIETGDFERPGAQMPAEVIELVKKSLAEKHSLPEPDIQGVRTSAYILPTGEFGDGPGIKTKIFRLRVVLG